MFESLSSNLSKIINKITSRGLLTEENIDQAMREIRVALLEADVSLSVVKELTNKIKEQFDKVFLLFYNNRLFY